MHNLFVSCPSVRGVHPLTMWNVFDMRTELEKQGDRLHGSSVYRMPLDLARNELATVFLSTSADLNLLLDDDVQIAAEWIPKMMAAIDAGCDIVSAPCRLRDHAHGGAQEEALFNIRPQGKGSVIGGVRVDECEWTGLGAVLVTRRVLETLHALDKQYASRLVAGKTSAAIFTSRVELASMILAGAPDNLNVYVLDDVVFSLKCLRAGFKIHAAVDVPTVHDGMAGCFSAEMSKRARERQISQVKLVGADGRPAR